MAKAIDTSGYPPYVGCLADREMSLADGETQTVANEVTNPFEASLIDDMNGTKAALE